MSGDYPGNARKRRVTMTVGQLEAETVAAALFETNGYGTAALAPSRRGEIER